MLTQKPAGDLHFFRDCWDFILGMYILRKLIKPIQMNFKIINYEAWGCGRNVTGFMSVWFTSVPAPLTHEFD